VLSHCVAKGYSKASPVADHHVTLNSGSKINLCQASRLEARPFSKIIQVVSEFVSQVLRGTFHLIIFFFAVMEQLSSPAAHTRSRAGSSRGSSLGPAERGASDAADSRVSAAGGAGGVPPPAPAQGGASQSSSRPPVAGGPVVTGAGGPSTAQMAPVAAAAAASSRAHAPDARGGLEDDYNHLRQRMGAVESMLQSANTSSREAREAAAITAARVEDLSARMSTLMDLMQQVVLKSSQDPGTHTPAAASGAPDRSGAPSQAATSSSTAPKPKTFGREVDFFSTLTEPPPEGQSVIGSPDGKKLAYDFFPGKSSTPDVGELGRLAVDLLVRVRSFGGLPKDTVAQFTQPHHSTGKSLAASMGAFAASRSGDSSLTTPARCYKVLFDYLALHGRPFADNLAAVPKVVASGVRTAQGIAPAITLMRIAIEDAYRISNVESRNSPGSVSLAYKAYLARLPNVQADDLRGAMDLPPDRPPGNVSLEDMERKTLERLFSSHESFSRVTDIMRAYGLAAEQSSSAEEFRPARQRGGKSKSGKEASPPPARVSAGGADRPGPDISKPCPNCGVAGHAFKDCSDPCRFDARGHCDRGAGCALAHTHKTRSTPGAGAPAASGAPAGRSGPAKGKGKHGGSGGGNSSSAAARRA